MHARYRNKNQMSRSLSFSCLPFSLVSVRRTLHCACLTYSRSHVIPYAQANIYSTAVGYKQPHTPPHTHHDPKSPSAPGKRYSIYKKRRFANDLHHAFIRRRRLAVARRLMMISTTQRRSDGESGRQIGPTSALRYSAFCELGSPSRVTHATPAIVTCGGGFARTIL